MLVIKKNWPSNYESIGIRDLHLVKQMKLVLCFRKYSDCQKFSSETNNTSMVEILNSSNFLRDQHLIDDVAKVKEMMTKKGIQTEWIKGCEQISDCLTKVGASCEILSDLLL